MLEDAPKRGRKRGGRANGEGSIRQRADGRFEARIRLPNGKDKSFYGKSAKEVRKAMAEAMTDYAAGRDITRRRQRVGAYLDRWLSDVAAVRVSPRTLVEYESIVRIHLKPELGHLWLDALSPDDVQSFITAAHRSGLSGQRVSHLRAVLRTALSDAVRAGAVSRNVAKLVTLPPIDKAPVAPLKPAQARALLSATEGTTYGGTFAIALYCGLREGEVLGLRWQDVDLDAKELTVAQSLKPVRGGLMFGPPKSRRSRRTIPLPDAAIEVFRRQSDRQGFARHRAGAKWEENGLVFTKETGAPLLANTVRRALRKALVDAGLPPVTFHSLRHGCSTLLLESGVPLPLVSRILGHSTVALTLDTYGHIGLDAMRMAATAMDGLMARSEEAS